MKRCHTVYCISEMNINVCHVHAVHLINDIHSRIVEISSHSSIQFADDRDQMRYHFLQIRERPFFQRLCQDRMVCIRTSLAHHVHCSIDIKSFLFCQDTDQFRNDHSRMCIIDLDAHMLMKMIQIHPTILGFFEDQLCCIADHEILLINTQKLSCFITVIRIEEQCQVFMDLLFVELDSISNDALIYTVQIKQVQFVAAALISRYVNVIHGRFQGKIFKRNLKTHICFCQPALFCDPWIFLFPLFVVRKFLKE